MIKLDISLLLAVHIQTSNRDFCKTIESIYMNRHIPRDIIVIQDGPIKNDLHEDILKFIREKAETVYHPTGTCKMGFDQESVVDKKLKVHGIKGLRIADASIMPTLVSGNTNAVCMMIGERCADFILNG